MADTMISITASFYKLDRIYQVTSVEQNRELYRLDDFTNTSGYGDTFEQMVTH